MIETGAGWVGVRRNDGQKFVLMLDKLSDDGRTWLKAKENAAAAKEQAAAVQAAIVKWCKSQKGKQVGNGECWTLANEAFKSCGAKRPGGDLRVW